MTQQQVTNDPANLYVRAWVPPWGAERGSNGETFEQPSEDYSMWFIGHADRKQVEQTVLAQVVADAVAVGISEPEYLTAFFEQRGYVTFNTAGDGLVFVAQLPTGG